MPNDPKIKIYSQAIGRRKRSIAQVRLIAGSGEVVINNKKPKDYFGANQDLTRLAKPFSVLSLSKYGVTAHVAGGGKVSQLDALVLGIARALSELKKEFHDSLRTADLLTRDSRKKQRRMIGTGGKSRRKKQSPKR